MGVPSASKRILTGPLTLVVASVALLTGCLANRVARQATGALIEQTLLPPMELGISAGKFREETGRWPRNYEELSLFIMRSGGKTQSTQYDRVDFIENADGSLEVYAISSHMTNRMTLRSEGAEQK